MQEIKVDKNIQGQRLDRYVRKYLDKANLSFIYRMIRKGNIEVNGSKVKKDYVLKLGDTVQFWLADNTIAKFQSVDNSEFKKMDLNIVYEDDNIIIIDKDSGVLSHSSESGDTNIVDGMVQYLIDCKKYSPKKNITFTPSIANRLDKNTSGLIIGGINLEALRQLNKAFEDSKIKRYYVTIVRGELKGAGVFVDNIEYVDDNTVVVGNSGREIITGYKSIETNGKYTLVEIDLITGRKHQIRAHLAYRGHPIIGDNKYGSDNTYFAKKYGLKHQLLHCSKVILNGMSGSLEYLNKKEFESKLPKLFENILKGESL